MNYINTFFSSLAHLLYPVHCAGCGSDLLSEKQLICVTCLRNLPFTRFHHIRDNPVEKIFWGRIPVSMATACVYFSKDSIIRNLLHQLKYRQNKEVGLYFGRIMGESIVDCGLHEKIQGLIPLPLNVNREKKRGFNQSAVICEGMARVMHVPVLDQVIVRQKNTTTQTRKSRVDRWINMEGNFRLVNKNAVQNKHLLLVDDVITTGATLEACGAELLNGTGITLSIAALAYTSL